MCEYKHCSMVGQSTSRKRWSENDLDPIHNPTAKIYTFIFPDSVQQRENDMEPVQKDEISDLNSKVQNLGPEQAQPKVTEQRENELEMDQKDEIPGLYPKVHLVQDLAPMKSLQKPWKI